MWPQARSSLGSSTSASTTSSRRRGRVTLIKIYAIIGGLADKRTNMIDVIEDYDEDDDPSYDEGDADADDFVEDNEIMRAMKILVILG